MIEQLRPADIQPSKIANPQNYELYAQCSFKSLNFKKSCYTVKVNWYIIFKRNYQGREVADSVNKVNWTTQGSISLFST